jgi:hypothetical protein
VSLPFAIKHEAMSGLIEVLDGKRDQGIARAHAALDRCGHQNPYPGFQAAVTRILVAAHTAAGDAQGGLDACQHGLSLGGTPLWDAELHRARAELLHHAGAPAEDADDALRAAAAVAQAQGAWGHLRQIDGTRRRLGLDASAFSS